jgi:ribonuclease J
MDSKKPIPTRIFALGGIEKIGKNCYVIEHDNELFIIDCGVKFCDDTIPGVSGTIPPFEYLKANKDKIKGLIVTHAHEDHIGGIPYLLREIPNIKVYGAKFTCALIKKKLSEHKDLHGIVFEEIKSD